MSVRKRKQTKAAAYSLAKPVAKGTILSDAFKRNFVVGTSIGQGGFGCIYSVKLDGDKQEKYVAKIEPQENGPLFTEIHFYIRVCNQDSIKEWKNQRRLKYLGIPRYVASGLFAPPGQTRCRYLVMDRFSGDIENVLKQGRLSTAGVVQIASNVLDALEYIHSKDYAHADIKASNLLYESKVEEVYLVDFGLVHLFRLGGVHCAAKPDPKYQHNGTLEFCSLDSHRGLPPSRRGDLEILLFNLVHWLARCQPHATQAAWFGLPWGHLISDPKVRENVPISVTNQISAIKEKTVKDLPRLFAATGLSNDRSLHAFAQIVTQLRYDETPNYAALKQHLNDLHKVLLAGTSRPLLSGHKRSSSEGIATPEDLQDATAAKQPAPKEVPVKRSRGRPAAASKAVTKKKTAAATPSVDPLPSPSPISRRAPSGAKANSKTTTINGTLLPPSGRATSPSDTLCHTPTRVTQLRSETEVKRSGLSTPTRSSPRLQAANATTRSPLPSYQRQPLIHFRDLFTSSEDESSPTGSVDGLERKRCREPTGRKVLSPLNPSRAVATVPTLNTMKNERVGVKPPIKSTAGRRSACCQTSPELLALAKAEALGRRAAELANAHFR